MRELLELLRLITLSRMLISKRPLELMPSLRPTKLLLRLLSPPLLILTLPPLVPSLPPLLSSPVPLTKIELISELLRRLMLPLLRLRKELFMLN